MDFRSSLPPKEYPKYSLFEFLFKHHAPYDEDEKITFINASDEKRFFTFNDVKDKVLQVSAGLTNTFGFQRKDIVAICSPNEMLYPIVLHGAVTAGGITATIDHTLRAESLASNLDLLQPKVLVTHEDILDKVLEAVKISSANICQSHILIFGEHCLRGIRTVQEVLLDHGELGVPAKYQPDELEKTVAYLYFTSGSTGAQKAVMITHAMMIASLSMHDLAHASNDDICLAYNGFQHFSSLWMTMHASLYYGVTTVILPQFSLELFCEAVQRFKITQSFVQPWIVSSLDREPIVNQFDISSLKLLVCGGAASEKSVMNSLFKNRNVATLNVYGLTELAGVFNTTPKITLQGGLGMVERGVIAKLLDDDGNEVGVGKHGELCAKSPTRTMGYYKNQVATDKAIDSEGYFHTGDIFTVDKDGIFYYLDRKKNLIKYYLQHIHPQTIENVLVSHPKVTDCGVVGVFSKELVTELPRAYVQLADGQEASMKTVEELKSFLEVQVDDFMKLRGGLYIVKNLPRTGSGKVNRLKLTELGEESIIVSA